MNNDHLNKTNNPVNMASLSGVLTVFIGLGIIFIGVREFAYPSSGAEGFGVPLLSSSDSDLLAIKAARDVASDSAANVSSFARAQVSSTWGGRVDSHSTPRWFDRFTTFGLDVCTGHSDSRGDCGLNACHRGIASTREMNRS